MKTKTINLGYIHMASFTKKSRLFSSWMYRDPEYREEIATTDPEEIILPPNKKFQITIDYPLSTPFIGEIKTPKEGMTRREVVQAIVNTYKAIYAAEDESSTIPAGMVPGMFNRISTNGKYGIWGHVLDDLMLHTLFIKGNQLTISCDS